MTQGKDGAKNQRDAADPTDTPFQRFLRAARHIVNVPKSAVEKRERKTKEERP